MSPGLVQAWDALLTNLPAEQGQSVSVAIAFSNNVDDVSAVDTTLVYDPSVLALDSVDNGAEFAAFAKVVNLSVPGQARIAQFTFGSPMSHADGTVLTFNFRVSAAAPTGASQLQVTRLDFGSDTSGTIPANAIPFAGLVTVNNGNAAPVLNPVGSQSVPVGNAISFTISATDADGDTLTYGASPLPGMATIDPFTGAFSWTPQSGDEGLHVVTFTVDDGNGGTDSAPVTITVTRVGPPAHDAVVGSATVSQGESFDVAIMYSNNVADVVGVDAILAWDPAILAANSVSNGSTFSGFQDVENLTTPGQANIAQFSVGPSVSASSGQVFVINFTAIASGTSALTLSRLDFGTDTVTYPVNNVTGGSVTVQVPANNTPIMNSIGSRTVQAGMNLSFTLSATDADGDGLTYGATSLPAGAMLDPMTGVFSWTPTLGQVGIYNVTFDADDGNGAMDSEEVIITVTGAGGGVQDAVVGGATVQQGDSFNIAIDFSNNSADVIGVDTTLTWDPVVLTANSVSNGSTFSGFQRVENLTTPGQAAITQFGFSAVSAPNGQVLVINFTALAPGTSAINLTRLDFGSDASGNTPVDNITNGTVTVQTTANTSPVLNPIGNRMTMEGATFSFDVSGSDADGDSLTFAAAPLAGFMSFVGTTFTATPDFNDAGVFDVTFSIFDGTDTATEVVQITVANVNRDPVLATIGNKSVAENAMLSFMISASDLDGDPVTVTTSALQSWMNFDGTTFMGTPGNNDAGTYQVTFTAADGNTGTDQETVTITVTQANRAPDLNPIADQTLQEGATLNVTFTASDLDGDSLTLMFNGAESWMSFDGTTLTLTPQIGDSGTYPVSINVSDGDLTDTETFDIIVTPLPMNMAPELDPVGNQMLAEGESRTLNFTATDPDGDNLTFNVTGGQPWMTFSGSTLILAPQTGDAGTYLLTVSVSDGSESDFEEITVTVMMMAGNSPPALDPIGDRTVKEGEMLMFEVSGADPDEDSLTFSANVLPEGAVFDSGNTKFTWQTQKGDAGEYDVTFTITDGQLSEQETITIYVVEGGFTLNVEKFPYHQSLDNGADSVRQFSGPAVLKMILQYIWWNRFDDPDGPPELEDPLMNMQTLLYEYGQPMNYAVNQELARLDGWGLWQTIQNLDPPYNPFHYNFGLKARLILEDALRDIAEWLAYPAGGGGDNPDGHGVDGYPVHIPGAVPLYGNYDYWVIIKGIQTTVDPYRNADFGICGFWINDPHPQGLGQDTYVTADQFTAMYYWPLTEINPDDPLYNHYVALVEPPQDDNGQVTIVASVPRLKKHVRNFLQLQTVEMEDGSEKNVYVRDHLDEDAFALIEAAITGLQEQLVPFDDEFAALFVQTIPRKPIFVDGFRGDYYLIPFELPVDADNVQELRSGFRKGRMLNESGDELTREEGQRVDRTQRQERRRMRREMRQRTVIIALIDAESGAFKEVSWVKDPMSYMPVGKRQALRLIAKHLYPDSDRRVRRGMIHEMRDGAEMELIHTEGSFYYPVWRVYYEGDYYLVDQQGSVSAEE